MQFVWLNQPSVHGKKEIALRIYFLPQQAFKVLQGINLEYQELWNKHFPIQRKRFYPNLKSVGDSTCNFFPLYNSCWACKFDILFSIFVRNSMLSMKNVYNQWKLSVYRGSSQLKSAAESIVIVHSTHTCAHCMVKSGREHAEKTISTNGKNNLTLTKSVRTSNFCQTHALLQREILLTLTQKILITFLKKRLFLSTEC